MSGLFSTKGEAAEQGGQVHLKLNYPAEYDDVRSKYVFSKTIPQLHGSH